MEADLRRTRSPRETASPYEAMVAGCVAGSIGQLVGFPLDTLKVRTQLQATREMALFSGWRVPVATAGAINCANFGVYDSAWRSLSDVDDDVDAPSSVVFAAGACGGFVISPVSTVISRVKVLQQSCAFPGMNVRDVCRSLVEGGGMRSLWCGFSANFCMECCRGFYMLFFVGAKRYLGGERKDLALWKRSLDQQQRRADPENQVDGFLGEGLPEGMQLWSKAGWMSQARHDAAWFQAADQPPTLLVVFTAGPDRAKDEFLLPELARQLALFNSSEELVN